MISIPGRIPIHIFPFFWLLIVVIGWLNSETLLGTVLWSVVILISVLVHEYGHALTALAFGQESEISLVGLGGVTKRKGGAWPLSKWKEFIIVLNGPLAGIFLFFLAYKLFPFAAKDKFPLLREALRIAVNVNLFWTILNLVPVLPLDGGHLMRILLEGCFGFKGLKIALWISIILAAFFGLYFFLIQQIFIGALFLMMGFESYRSLTEMGPITSQDAQSHLKGLLNEAIEDLRMGKQDEAFAKFVSLREQTQRGVLHLTATQYLARILAEKGHYKQAYGWLMPIRKHLTVEYLRLLQNLAYRIQEWNEAAQIGQEIFQKDPSADVALLNALSYAIMGQAKPAVGWLRSAIQSGLANIPSIINKREFDAIRHSKEFQTWLKSQKV